ncbi:hypothetical protein [Roseateles saccharophilus]|nr:hypothetical protein [Roseateles saccharophilus]
MYTIPTLKGTAFALAGYGLALALLLVGAGGTGCWRLWVRR